MIFYFIFSLFSIVVNAKTFQIPEYSTENPILPTESKIAYYSEINNLNKTNELDFFKPASTLKVLTAFTALQTLGEHFQFETILKIDISKNDPSHIGNLELHGFGDPTLGAEDFGEMINKRFIDLSLFLKNKGIKKINFPIKFISELKKSDFRKNFITPKGWTENDVNSCYGFSALPSAFHFRENCSLYTIKSLKKGTWDLQKLTKKLVLNLTYGNTNRFEVKFDKISNNHILSGTYRKGSKPSPIPIPLLYEDTLQLIESEFESSLKEAGIEVIHEVFNEEILKSDFIKILSPELIEMIKPFLKNSLNFVGESIMLAIGNLDYSKAMLDLNLQLNKFSELKSSKEVLMDGSGLSRENNITPKTLFNLLTAIKSNPVLHSIFLESLAVSGIDGTLKNRLGGQLTSKIRGKTGSLDGISNLIGYAIDQKNTWQPFVIFNQSSTLVNPRDEVDALVTKFLK